MANPKANSPDPQAKPSLLSRLLDGVWRLFISLKFAVFVMICLTGGMAAATILESLYDTPTGKFWVYDAFWFHAVLFLLGVNIFAVALSRWPWKPRHIPFLIAHVGILMVLVGSWVTYQFGIDANLRIEEGKTSNLAEVPRPELVLSDGKTLTSIPVKWTPPHAKFEPIEIPEYGLTISQFVTYADASVSFVPSDQATLTDVPAARVKITGGPMRVSQEYWLWAGDPSYANVAAGPAFFFIRPDAQTANALDLNRDELKGRPRILLKVKSNGDILYESRNSENALRSGLIRADQARDAVIEPGWKGDVKITLLEVIPRATSRVSYTPSRLQYKPQSPPSAIYIVAGKGGPSSEMWLGLGDRAMLASEGREISIAYTHRQVPIPFSVRLERFTIEHYEGTRDPASYSSLVSVIDGSEKQENVTISMNEPLHYKGFTLYQASYENGEPRPTVSIFSVNRDPGRDLKYYGSLLIVLGSIALFAVKSFKRKQGSKPAAPASEVNA